MNYRRAWGTVGGRDMADDVPVGKRAQAPATIRAKASGALGLRLDASALAAIDAAVPVGQVAGDRYEAAQMAHLDSER